MNYKRFGNTFRSLCFEVVDCVFPFFEKSVKLMKISHFDTEIMLAGIKRYIVWFESTILNLGRGWEFEFRRGRILLSRPRIFFTEYPVSLATQSADDARQKVGIMPSSTAKTPPLFRECRKTTKENYNLPIRWLHGNCVWNEGCKL